MIAEQSSKGKLFLVKYEQIQKLLFKIWLTYAVKTSEFRLQTTEFSSNSFPNFEEQNLEKK